MISPREAVEQAIFVAVGAASLTRDRAQAIVDDLVRRGQMTDEEGRLTVDGLMARVRNSGEGQGIVGKIEERVAEGVFTAANREELIALAEGKAELIEGGMGDAYEGPK